MGIKSGGSFVSRQKRIILFAGALFFAGLACSINVDLGLRSTETPMPSSTATTTPSATPTDPRTPRPSNTPAPTRTPVPSRTATPASPSGGSSSSFASCSDSSGGKDKVRIENRTGETFTIYFYGPENAACTIVPGVNVIYLLRGKYNLNFRACGGLSFGNSDLTINATWKFYVKCP